jgi:hypothetical protein
LFWVADDLNVYRSSTVPAAVSTPFITDRLNAAQSTIAQTTAFAVSMEGHVFYVVNLPGINESYAYDATTQEWAQWGTQTGLQSEPGVFIGSTAAGYADSGTYIGSSVDGRIWLLDANNNMDDTVNKRVVVSATAWIPGGVQRCNNVSLACVRGVGNTASPNPIVEMRFSDNGGRTFTSWLQAKLGAAGQYGYKATWRNLGLIQQPGRLFEFAVADPVNFTVEGCTINEARV